MRKYKVNHECHTSLIKEMITIL